MGRADGVWGVQPFENDDAQTFLAEVLEDGPVAIEEAIDVALDAEDDLQAPEGARAVAALALLGAILTGNGEGLPADLRAWVTQFPPETLESLRAPALTVLELVDGETSELRERWQDAEGYLAWQSSLNTLRARLTDR
ncbi:DUF4259 domain-containing protein [Deinococcus peraridilitoris]|uniref:DUF4259 domain-containing protein n=1 Tax=Deinococcus peraridilitoris (strain DSM 19664 / LMG 22246 / CIP 109416 / KR-200) TaxID=937777 RepID=L0A6I7_DEIPD|nr:DUF4259 domain-containing protein [Deinococcus peraridilitoris]AFZ68797.1 hypothetical protein Deipe_3357 [Deinococcus peraridilitoris DSM 19664]